MTDLVFALDSVPAVLAITTDCFTVITSNIFAILGLRSMYILESMINKLYHMRAGLTAILFLVGTKMLLSHSFNIAIVISVGVILTILSVATILSLLKTRLSLEAKT